jgi:hypothetical protein
MSSATWLALADAVAAEQRLRRRIRLLTSEQQTLLVTWGVSRPTVLVPSSASAWSEERVRVVLGHEMSHIRRHDWLTLMIAEVVRALYWFNPLVWIACRRLREESERACDDMVLGLGIESTVYASHLLEIARSLGQMRRVWLPAPAMVRQSSLERRISAMLNPGLDRRPVTRGAGIATIAAALALTGSIAGFGAALQTFGSLPGSVVDSTNRPVAGATLVLTGAPNDAKRELKSDGAGILGGSCRHGRDHSAGAAAGDAAGGGPDGDDQCFRCRRRPASRARGTRAAGLDRLRGHGGRRAYPAADQAPGRQGLLSAAVTSERGGGARRAGDAH